MATIFAQQPYPGLVRCAGSFKDGKTIRHVELHRGRHGKESVIAIKSTEGEVLYRLDYLDLRPDLADFQARTIACEHSSYTGTVVVILGGLPVGSGDGLTVIVNTDYRIAPEVHYAGA